MLERPQIALIVLTAGRSSRMGEPKALLRFGKQTALELAVRNAIRAGIQRVVAVLGHRAEEIRAAHHFAGLPVAFDWVVNHEADAPMLSSLQAGLRRLARLRADAFFFQPVDLPLVTAYDFRRLIDAYCNRVSGEKVFIPSFQERAGHPVLCDASLIGEFLQLAPERTARDFLREQRIAYVETGNPGVLEDMDTRDDYRRLRQVYEAREGAALPPLSVERPI
jgi:CTP:molybdopterin cytidylyltransferase MocA